MCFVYQVSSLEGGLILSRYNVNENVYVQLARLVIMCQIWYLALGHLLRTCLRFSIVEAEE